MRLTRLLVAVALLGTLACAKHAPPSLTPAGVPVWQANEAVVVLGALQSTAIGLNAIQVCEGTAPCHPVLNDASTRLVVDGVRDAVQTITQVPAGWRPTDGLLGPQPPRFGWLSGLECGGSARL